MKKTSLLGLFLGLLCSLGIAQNTSLNGPTVDMERNASLWVLDDNDDQIVFATLQPGIPSGYEDFLIHRYDKRAHSIETQKLDDDLDCRFAYLYNDQVIAVKQGMDSKTKSVDYLKAPVPAVVSDKAIKKLPFTSFYQVPLEGYKYSFCSTVFSPDHSKFAILTILKPKSNKQISHVADVAVFENTGELLWHQRQNAHWVVNDEMTFYLSDEGVVYLAEYGSYYNAYLHQIDSLHISVYNNGDIWNYAEGFGAKAVFNCGKALLKDGRFVVCGVPCQNNRNSGQLITYFVSPDGDVEKEESSFEFPFNDEFRYEYNEFNNGLEKFLPYIFDIKELNDGKLMLVGELNYRTQVGTTVTIGASFGVDEIMGYASRNLFVTTLTDKGDVLTTYTYPRATSTPEIRYMVYNLNTPDVFMHDGDFWLIYNDHKDNFAPNNKIWHLLHNNQAGNVSVVVTQALQQGEFNAKTIFTAGKSPYLQTSPYSGQFEFFHKILSNDDDAVYYLIKHDNHFHVERITW